MHSYSVIDITSNEHKGEYDALTSVEALTEMRRGQSEYEPGHLYLVTSDSGFELLACALTAYSIEVLHRNSHVGDCSV